MRTFQKRNKKTSTNSSICLIKLTTYFYHSKTILAISLRPLNQLMRHDMSTIISVIVCLSNLFSDYFLGCHRFRVGANEAVYVMQLNDIHICSLIVRIVGLTRHPYPPLPHSRIFGWQRLNLP